MNSFKKNFDGLSDKKTSTEAHKQFLRYHHENPSIYATFDKYAWQTINRGFKHYGARSLFEVIRWHTGRAGKNDHYKINNNYVARYARLWMKNNPKYDGYFRTRRQQSQN